MYQKIISLLFVLIMIFALPSCSRENPNGGHPEVQPLELSYPIVDTGVVTFYSDKQIISAPAEGEPFCGQDANYQGNSPSYTDNDDGTVTDNVTGLMWQQDMGKKMTYALSDLSDALFELTTSPEDIDDDNDLG